jgi:uncharacterized protein involved in exopolysaccharide biosynthesis
MAEPRETETTILDWARIVLRRWPWVIAVTIAAVLVGYVMARMQPKVYSARATILTPKDTSTSAAMGGFLSGMGGRGEGGGMLSVPAVIGGLQSTSAIEDMFLATLKSRSMRERVNQELAKKWGPGVGSMILSTDVRTPDKGVIEMVVEATDPGVAADVANVYFDQLDKSLEENAAKTRKRQERFYASQLDQSAKEVAAAQEAVLKFQSQNNMLVNLDSSGKKEFDSAVSLRGSIMVLELQREMLKMRVTDEHPSMRDVNRQIAEMKKQYSQNLYGAAMELPAEDRNARGTRHEFFVAAARMTPLQFEFLKIFRNLKIQEAFYTGALQQLTQMKYQDGASPMIVEVLDEARPASGPSRPNVRAIITASLVGGLVAGCLLTFVLEYLARVRAADRRRTASAPVRSRRFEERPEPHAVSDGDEARRPANGGVAQPVIR